VQSELGWAPEVSFEKGLADTVDWTLTHRGWTGRVISGEYRDFYERNHGHRDAWA